MFRNILRVLLTLFIFGGTGVLSVVVLAVFNAAGLPYVGWLVVVLLMVNANLLAEKITLE